MQDQYQMKIIAKDGGGSKQLSSSVSLKINILDSNDNSPIFYPLEYFVSLPSSPADDHHESLSVQLALDQPLVEVKASDHDVGKNAELSYRWETGNNFAQRYLRLDDKTGKIYPKRSLISSSYYDEVTERSLQKLKVHVSDGGGKSSTELATIYFYQQSHSDRPHLFKETDSPKFSIVEDNGLIEADSTILHRQGM